MSLPPQRAAVLLDRHPLWLEAVEQVLTRLGFTVAGKSTHPEEALKLLEARRPDLFITSLEFGDGDLDGLTCIRRAGEHVPGIRAIVLSMESDPQQIEAALESGAVAYVMKTAHADDLASAIRQAFDNSVFVAGSRPTPIMSMHIERAPEQSSSSNGSSRDDSAGLTRREIEILKLVSEGHSNAELAKMLWVTEQTVKFHLSNVYRKLDVSNRTEASRWAQLNGLLTPVVAEASVA